MPGSFSLPRIAAALTFALTLAQATFASLDGIPFESPVAIRGATVIAEPGRTLERATVLIRDGRIAAVGIDVAIPPGTRVIDGAGLYVYPGFIDAFSRTGVKADKLTKADERRIEDDFQPISDGPRTGFEEANRNGIFARRSVVELLDVQDDTFKDQRRAGFTAALLAPPRAIIAGRAALVQLGDRPVRRSIVADDVAQVLSFEPPPPRALVERDRYPRAIFGVIAHLRQTLSDAAWYARMKSYVQQHPEASGLLPVDADLDALQTGKNDPLPVIWEADDFEEIRRALALAKELNLKPTIAGAREAHRVADDLRHAGVAVLLELRAPDKPAEFKFNLSEYRATDTESGPFGRGWEKRPFEPRAAYDEAKRLRTEEVTNALALEKAGVPWCVTTQGQEKPRNVFDFLRELGEAGLSADAALRALTATPARVLGAERELGAIAVGRRGNLTITTRPLLDKDSKVRLIVVDGAVFEMDEPGERSKSADRAAASLPATAAASSPASTTTASAPTPLDDILGHEPAWPLALPADRDPGVRTGGSVLLKNALVLTISGDDLPDTDVLVEQGRIKAVGKNLAAPAGVRTIDLGGYVVMPGVIDPHSHIALDSVNEFSLSVTCEVRCADVVRSDDLSIYYALAGGCTTIHAMHGSANTIGGQCVLLKLKYGRPAAELILPDAPRTVKFALGENVKRSGIPRPWYLSEGCTCERTPRRFPGTRMGVEATMRRALQDGRQYGEALAASGKTAGAPFRRDIRLETLADIAAGKIWINCHSYRADEILRLLSVAEEFGLRINNLHHCLEAYRIMPEIVRHGCGTATFADWWAYKIEAYDAVPHNAGMLLRAGVNSTIKSDSAELMRHMPLEAAKCMKYSGLTPNEALHLVTLNAAKMFGLDQRLGTIDAGKEADLAVYDGHPLDTFSKCVLTLVDGEIYFRHPDFDLARPARPARPVKTWPAPVAAANGVVDPPAPPAPAPGKAADVWAITNATLHPISAAPIENGTLVIRDGKIASVGTTAAPADATVIDARGLHVWPGLINAGTVCGLDEIGMVEVTVDTNEPGTFQPDLMAVSALNPHSAMIQTTRAEGVLTCVLLPGGPTVAGQVGLVDLNGWTMNEMLREPRLALLVALPSKPVEPLLKREPRRNPEWEEDEDKPDEAAIRNTQREVERFFRDARLYAEATRTAGAAAPLKHDARFDAMIPYVLGEKPVIFSADSYKQILEALQFAQQHNLRPVILGGRDAWKCADLLARRNVPVIYEGVFSMPDAVNAVRTAAEWWNAHYRAPAVMAAAGVKFCFANRSASLAKLLPIPAGFAVAHGLDPDRAVRALTLDAAEILGVARELGSLEPGKVANVILTTDHVCQATGTVRYAFIRGRPIDLSSKHTRDADRFLSRPAGDLAPPRNDLKGPPAQTSASR